MSTYQAPGVYRQEVIRRAPVELSTGVPAFLGVARERARAGGTAAEREYRALDLWSQFEERFELTETGSFLGHAVRGFFDNGGSRCYVVPVPDLFADGPSAIESGLAKIEAEYDLDLVCAPDIMGFHQREMDRIERLAREEELDRQARENEEGKIREAVHAMQAAVLAHCERVGGRLAIVDSLRGADNEAVLAQAAKLKSRDGALYHPWIAVADTGHPGEETVPPCGHVAGVYARCDDQVGVHKPPANEVLRGVLDPERRIDEALQATLNPPGINCIRAFPGRGIRIWGARTIGGVDNGPWMYVSVRRIFLTAGRWIELRLQDAVFEPNDLRLWARIERELYAYFEDLFRRGGLRGRTADEAFYIKCDAETNPEAVRDAGQVVTEIGLAPGVPNEFVVVQLIHGASGTRISGPLEPAA